MATWLERRMSAQTEGLRDGEAAALEEDAFDASVPRAVPDARAFSSDPAAARRAVLDEALAEKVLRAHLHNAFQIAFPLVLNFGNHSEGEARLLAEVAAAAATSGADRRRGGEVLAQQVGAPPEAVRCFETASANPRPLQAVIGEVVAAGLEAHAYAVALVAVPRPAPAEEAFLAYLAARLGLGTDVVAGLTQRYRR